MFWIASVMPALRLKPLAVPLLAVSVTPFFLQPSAAQVDSETQISHERGQTAEARLSKQAYAQSLQGFWLGQSIGNWTGLITEMDKVEPPFYTDEDWGKADQKAIWGEYVPHASRIDFYFEPLGSPWGADDDTDIEYMYQYLLERHGMSVLSPKQIAQGWLTHTYSEEDAPLFKKFTDSTPQKENFLWQSNARARVLMSQGILPPHTSDPASNDKTMMIDAQLTTEIFGLFAPLRPDVAEVIAALPIAVAARNEAAQIARFYVRMHSLAAAIPAAALGPEKALWLAQQARVALAENGYPADMYRFILNHYLTNPDKEDWESTRDAVYQRYQQNSGGGYHYRDPFEAGINFAASLVSWFYGEGDIVKTIRIGTLMGWDSDNPTATWGGLLGFILGRQGVMEAFALERVSDTYWIHRTRRGFPDHTPHQAGEDSFAQMAERALTIIDRVVLEQLGGKLDGEKRYWLIPIH